MIFVDNSGIFQIVYLPGGKETAARSLLFGDGNALTTNKFTDMILSLHECHNCVVDLFIFEQDTIVALV